MVARLLIAIRAPAGDDVRPPIVVRQLQNERQQAAAPVRPNHLQPLGLGEGTAVSVNAVASGLREVLGRPVPHVFGVVEREAVFS